MTNDLVIVPNYGVEKIMFFEYKPIFLLSHHYKDIFTMIESKRTFFKNKDYVKANEIYRFFDNIDPFTKRDILKLYEHKEFKRFIKKHFFKMHFKFKQSKEAKRFLKRTFIIPYYEINLSIIQYLEFKNYLSENNKEISKKDVQSFIALKKHLIFFRDTYLRNNVNNDEYLKNWAQRLLSCDLEKYFKSERR